MFGKSYDDGIFSVGRKHGFLPKAHPKSGLPPEFGGAQRIIDKLPAIVTGLSAAADIEEEVVKLEDLSHLLLDASPELAHLVYRAYTFIASCYLLSPSRPVEEGGAYGKARTTLPRQVARPLCRAAELLGQKPWLDYHYAYSLGNYVQLDPERGYEWSNLGMACSFTGNADEAGFIMLHVDINGKGPALLDAIDRAVSASASGDLEELRSALSSLHRGMVEINETRKLMWQASAHKNYNSFRQYIMGITGNENIFGDGVYYEGVDTFTSTDADGNVTVETGFSERPHCYRGQTGAQDDIIPTMDIITGVIDFYPENDLTKYLLELREYRPLVVQRFFADLQAERGTLAPTALEDPEAARLLALIVETIFLFRNGHWQFVQWYIMKNTSYAQATGGTPVTSWLPNQMLACLQYIKHIIAKGNVEDEDLEKRLGGYELVLRKQLKELEGGLSSGTADRVIDLENGQLEQVGGGGACPFSGAKSGDGGGVCPAQYRRSQSPASPTTVSVKSG